MAINASYSITPIGTVSSPYKEKFAIPRQPGLVTAAKGFITLDNQLDGAAMVSGLEKFSHIWVLFIFHQTLEQGWKPKVRPPRLGGNQKLGVLATRSTFRPNGIGMSVVKLDGIEHNAGNVHLHISGLDLLDQTPVVDIKPYIQYSDALPDAESGYANEAPLTQIDVHFCQQAMQQLNAYPRHLAQLITQVLKQDPRPAYKQGKPDTKQYGMHLDNVNILWHFTSLTRIEVVEISPR
ncbi:tRNA (N6-threonylcarbamoyladenosine(37)-N6)-methyltransferase TrmO [Colwellia sp. MEBiC06753]